MILEEIMMKKFLAMLLSLVMILAMGTTALAAGTDGSITLNNATVGEEYKIYKVFDLTYSGDGETSGSTSPYSGPIAYTFTKTSQNENLYTALSGETSPFELTQITTTDVYSVSLKSEKTAEDVSTFLKTNVANLTEVTGKATEGVDSTTGKANNKTVKWGNLDYGYYYITSSLGSTVTIDSTIKDVTIEDKNSVPTQDKKQAVGDTQPGADGYADDDQQVQVGDKVWYQIEVTDGKGTNQAITITDTMTDGLTYNNDLRVYSSISNATETEVTSTDATWKTKTTPVGATFQIELTSTYVSTLNENDKVYIRFSATVNSLAASNTGATTETNTSQLDYSNNSTTDRVTVQTYKFQLDKVKADYTDLLGAKFELYRSTNNAANKIWFVKGTEEGTVPVLIVVGQGADAPTTGLPTGTTAFSVIELTSGEAGNSLNSSKVIIKGLDQDTYVLHETEAPSGYNLLTDDITIEPTDDNHPLVEINGTITDVTNAIEGDSHVLSVVNQSGTELPSTGGIGTTIFYVVGSILVIGAVIFFVVRRRMKTNGEASE